MPKKHGDWSDVDLVIQADRAAYEESREYPDNISREAKKALLRLLEEEWGIDLGPERIPNWPLEGHREQRMDMILSSLDWETILADQTKASVLYDRHRDIIRESMSEAQKKQAEMNELLAAPESSETDGNATVESEPEKNTVATFTEARNGGAIMKQLPTHSWWDVLGWARTRVIETSELSNRVDIEVIKVLQKLKRIKRGDRRILTTEGRKEMLSEVPWAELTLEEKHAISPEAFAPLLKSKRQRERDLWHDFVTWVEPLESEPKLTPIMPDYAANARMKRGRQLEDRNADLVSAWVKAMREKPKSFRTQAAKNVAKKHNEDVDKKYNEEVAKKHKVGFQIVKRAVMKAGKWDSQSTE